MAGEGQNASLTVWALTQRIMLRVVPALSLVPEARAPPKGC